MPSKIDMTGIRFGHLVVVAPAESRGRQTRWVCQCDCGSVITTPTRMFRFSGKTSCGCDTFSKRSDKMKTHGLTKSRTYKSWMMMKSRCANSNYSHYKYYGGRGIKVCQEWVDSFETFMADMGVRPDGGTLDRIDSDGDYTKENCRWATREQQVDNRRNAVYATLGAVTLKLKEWAALLRVRRSQIYLAMYHGETLAEFVKKRKLEARVIEYQTGGLR